MRVVREWIRRVRATLGPGRRDDGLEEEPRLRDRRRLLWLEDVARDVSYGLRTLRRHP